MSTKTFAAIMFWVCFGLFLGAVFSGAVLYVLIMVWGMRMFFNAWDRETK